MGSIALVLLTFAAALIYSVGTYLLYRYYWAEILKGSRDRWRVMWRKSRGMAVFTIAMQCMSWLFIVLFLLSVAWQMVVVPIAEALQ